MDKQQKPNKKKYHGRPWHQNPKKKNPLAAGETAAETAAPDAVADLPEDTDGLPAGEMIIETAGEVDPTFADPPSYVLPESFTVPESVDDQTETVEIVGVCFRNGGKTYYFSPNGIVFEEGDAAIVETVRGVEFCEVSIPNRPVPKTELVSALKPVIRKADDADRIKNTQNKQLEESARSVWDANVKKNGLVMQLVDIEYTFDNAKLIFYFTADGRVDFRGLVKDLASVFRTRIELRQIGVRDKAKMVGGIGVCGRPFCCKTFLADFAQVSIKMAKVQNLSLASSKISGTCGRLMCCLRFEEDTYEREIADYPRPDTPVETSSGRGFVLDSNFLTGTVRVRMANGNEPGMIIKEFKINDIHVLGRKEPSAPVPPAPQEDAPVED